MRVLTLVVLFAGILVCPGVVCAQEVELSGRVFDPQGAGVAAATITVTRSTGGLVRTTMSGADGGYHVLALTPGAVIVEVERAGFRRLVRSVTLSADPVTTLDLQLDLSGVDETVVVTAAGMPQGLRETSKAVTSVESGEIHARQAATLAEIIRFAPGVQVRDTGGPGQLGSLRIRGLRSDAAAVLIDGLRFRDAASTQSDATGFFSNLHFIAADRVEVLRGSGSSLYGTNAVGGVVNIVTQAAGGPFGGEAQIEYGSAGQVRTRGSVSGSALNNRLAFSGGALAWDVADGLDGDDASRSTGGQGLVRFQINPATSVSARYFGSADRVATNASPSTSGIPEENTPNQTIVDAIAVAPDEIERLNNGEPFEIGSANYFPARNDSDARRRSDFQTIVLRADRQQSAAMNWQASYQRVDTSRTHLNGPLGPGFQSAFESESEFAGAIDTLDVRAIGQATPWLSVTGGYEFEREGYFERLDDHVPAPDRLITEARASQRSHAVFAAAQFGLMERRLQISVSGRAQTFRLSSPTFSTVGTTNPYEGVDVGQPPSALTGDLSAAYFIPATGTKLRAHVGNAYRAPALYERFGGGFFSDPATDVVVFSPFGDPRLSPDRYRSFDAGVDQFAFGERVLVSATVFVIDIQSLTSFDFSGGIDPATDPFGRFAGYVNGSGGSSKGLEAGFDARPSRTLRIQGSYTYTDAVTEDDITVPDFFGVPGVFGHTGSLMVSHTWGGRLETVANLFSASSSYGAFFAAGGSRAYKFPGFTSVGATASYLLPRGTGSPLRVYLRIDNLFNETFYLGGWRGPGRTAVAGISVGF